MKARVRRVAYGCTWKWAVWFGPGPAFCRFWTWREAIDFALGKAKTYADN